MNISTDMTRKEFKDFIKSLDENNLPFSIKALENIRAKKGKNFDGLLYILLDSRKIEDMKKLGVTTVQNDQTINQNLRRCFSAKNIPELEDNIKSTFNDNQKLKEIMSILLSQYPDLTDTWDEIKKELFASTGVVNIVEHKIHELIELGNKQIILHGAPGTGKTFSAMKCCRSLILGDEIEVEYNNLQTKEEKNIIDRILAGEVISDEEKTMIGDNNYIKYGQFKGRITFVQFHPMYDYTDFVEGLRPVKHKKESNSKKHKKSNTTIEFEIRDGIFMDACKRARKDKDGNNYYFIIDEINRADLNKVFGELLVGLEEDYRGKPITTQYSNLRERDEANFSIPSNIIIIGTMNDIDKSVSNIDFAIRRRFSWIEVRVEEVLENTLKRMIKKEYFKEIYDSAKQLNKCIIENYDKFGINDNYLVGPAYFKVDPLKPIEINKKFIWENKVMPLLKEYVRNYETNKVEEFLNTCKVYFQ